MEREGQERGEGSSGMLEEAGVVLRVEGELAIVKTQRSSMCNGCHSGGFCKALGGDSVTEVRREMKRVLGWEMRSG